MKYILFIVVIFLLGSCKKDTLLDASISNESLQITDTITIKISNNTQQNYLLYFENNRLGYFPRSPNSLNIEITDNNRPISVVFSSDPLFMIDEKGNTSPEDQKEMSKYYGCLDKNLIKIIPANKTILIKFPLIDSIDDCGAEYYPILSKEKLYKVRVKIRSDSNLIKKKGLEDINKLRKKYKFKIFQGELTSNTINLEN